MKKNHIPYRIMLDESQKVTSWYNIMADMPNKPAPSLNPETLKPLTAADLTPIFAEELCAQEVTEERYIDIPSEILDYYAMYRPAPLYRAYNLEKALDTPARIYYKYEGNNTSGSHKLNSAIAQVYYNKKQGVTNITTETGAGQWGTALSMACAHFGIDLTVFMVRVSYDQKPYRKAVMQTYGAQVHPSPSNLTNFGRSVLAKDPANSGSLGTAISEAIETAMSIPGSRYTLGSVLNHVLLHQSIIGQEAQRQLQSVDEQADIIIGCAGGGSNLGGLMAIFMKDKITGASNARFIAVEPKACPSLTRGRFAYDFCDVGHVTPLAKMYTLGSEFMPSSIHAGGLRYHGMSPILSQLYHDGYIEARALFQNEVFDAAVQFAKTEAILPAPESAHAIKVAIDEALKCRESGEEKVILFGLSGHGNFDLMSYSRYMEGVIEDYAPTDEELEGWFERLPKV